MSQHTRLLTISALTLISLTVSPSAHGQATPPEKDTGIIRTQVARIELGPEIEGTWSLCGERFTLSRGSPVKWVR